MYKYYIIDAQKGWCVSKVNSKTQTFAQWLQESNGKIEFETDDPVKFYDKCTEIINSYDKKHYRYQRTAASIRLTPKLINNNNNIVYNSKTGLTAIPQSDAKYKLFYLVKYNIKNGKFNLNSK